MKTGLGRLPGLALLLSAAACAAPQPSSPETKADGTSAFRALRDHVRVVFDGAGSGIVQTSVRTLRHDESGATVTMLSMQHFAKAEYYRGLEEYLRHADIVISEGAGGQRPGERLPDDRLPEEGLWVRRYNRVIVRLLDMESQADWEARIVDERWILADMSTAQLVESMEANDVAFLGADTKAYVERLEALVAGSPSAKQLADARSDLEATLLNDMLGYQGPKGVTRKLHDEREEVMWQVARDHLARHDHKQVAFVFGAWHTPYLESKLIRELGFRVVATCWYDCLVVEGAAVLERH